MRKIKDNFDAEIVNLRINKCINTKLLKFNIFLLQKLTSLLTNTIQTKHIIEKTKTKYINISLLLLHNTIKTPNNVLNK